VIIQQLHNGAIEPIARKSLYRCTDLEIVSTYNSELRGICNYYALASNFNKIQYFAYLMEYSCLKTLAGKHKTTSRKIVSEHGDGRGGWHIPYETAKGTRYRSFAKYMDCKAVRNANDTIVNASAIFTNSRNTFNNRLCARVCELCGKTDTALEIHHVNKVKNLKGKPHWEVIMIAKKRKTLAVCKDCHHKIHHP